MVAKSTATRKQKGREHQQQIATQIRTALDLPEEDVVSRPMGSQGLDVMLSARARERFPFGIECKRQEKLAIPEWWRQCEENARTEGLTPLLVFRRSHEDALAVLRWTDLLALVRDRCPDQEECPVLRGEDARRFNEYMEHPTDTPSGSDLIREAAKHGRVATRGDFNLKQARTDNFLSQEEHKMDIGVAMYRDYRNEGGRK